MCTPILYYKQKERFNKLKKKLQREKLHNFLKNNSCVVFLCWNRGLVMKTGNKGGGTFLDQPATTEGKVTRSFFMAKVKGGRQLFPNEEPRRRYPSALSGEPALFSGATLIMAPVAQPGPGFLTAISLLDLRSTRSTPATPGTFGRPFGGQGACLQMLYKGAFYTPGHLPILCKLHVAPRETVFLTLCATLVAKGKECTSRLQLGLLRLCNCLQKYAEKSQNYK